MLPRQQRLRTDRDFRSILRSRRVTRGHLLTLRVTPNTLKHHRFGFVVSRRVSKLATERNLIKRRLRTIARTLTIGAPNLDLLVSAQPPARTQSQSVLATELRQLITRLTHGQHRR